MKRKLSDDSVERSGAGGRGRAGSSGQLNSMDRAFFHEIRSARSKSFRATIPFGGRGSGRGTGFSTGLNLKESISLLPAGARRR